METTSVRAFIKRLNLMVLVVAALLSITFGYVAYSEMYRSEIWWAEKPTPEETAALKAFEANWVGDVPNLPKPKFDPDKYLADQKAKEILAAEMELSKRKRVAAVSRVWPLLNGAGMALATMGAVVFLMMLVSWLIGYGFKLHVSTK